jgi:hypothetical protein
MPVAESGSNPPRDPAAVLRQTIEPIPADCSEHPCAKDDRGAGLQFIEHP